MADFSISGRMKVKTLTERFKEAFGSTLRVYDGRSFADGATIGDSIAKKKRCHPLLASVGQRGRQCWLEVQDRADVRVCDGSTERCRCRGQAGQYLHDRREDDPEPVSR